MTLVCVCVFQLSSSVNKERRAFVFPWMVWELLPEDAAYGGYYHGYYSGYYAPVCRRGSAPMTCVRLRPIRGPGGNDRRRGFLCVAVFAWAVLTDEPRLRNGWFVFRPAPLPVWRSWREWKSQPGEVQQFITLRVTRGYRAGGDLGTGSAVLEHPGPQRPSAQQRVRSEPQRSGWFSLEHPHTNSTLYHQF